MADDLESYPTTEPDYAVPPGETIREFLDDLGMSQRQLATRLDLTPKHVNQLIQGLVPLSSEVALRLELVTGLSARMWNRLEADYQSTQRRLRQREDLAELTSWLAEMPVRELQSRGALPEQPKDKISRVQQLLAFFGVAHVSTYREIYEKPAVRFRKAKAYEANPGAVAAWLRMGELAAYDKVCQPFDKHGLQESLDRLRQLTLQPPKVFFPIMRDICSRHGVAVVMIPEIKGARASGATKWISPDKAMVLLSGRHKCDDQFWFTFFHEIAHVLKHGRSDVWIEDGHAIEDPRELQANQFAMDILIPPEDAKRLPDLRTLAKAQAFAAELGIAPSIVIGQLHRKDILPYRVGQKFKRKIDVADFEE
ncbi:XRE family transcriptional regulator [Acrocarpospora pleiomorpha]|uniref:XRE family transcriptional regulator n=1 Tax=Acrocarpospora pleiomorpha TaxID=90975 RepID=A0A5M3XQR7_9ACTN|nr:HigA family addiction module antitoxin [Acrocarpospora pleiomorpha]GES22389.1 XRE family transcriptional regulator [Acrocarpospora pleiomorpha]